MAVPSQRFAAVRAELVRQIEAGAYRAVGEKLGILAFLAHVMGGQRVDLRNSRHMRDEGGADGASGAHQVPVLHRVVHQLLGNHVQHGEPVLDDGGQLPVQTAGHNFRHRIAVKLLGPAPGDVLQLLIRPVDMGREGAQGDRADVFHPVGNGVGVGHHHLIGLLLAEILELRQHLAGGAQVQRRLVVRVGEPLPRHKDPAIHLVLRIHEVDVAGGAHRDVQLLAQADDGAVELLQLLLILGNPLPHHKGVVAKRLDLQKIVEPGDVAQLAPWLAVQDGPEQFPLLTGAADD